MEVIVGTYDQVVVGFDVIRQESELEYRLKPKFAERAHAGCVKCVANSGHFLATGSSDETIRLYSLKDHRELGTLVQHEGSITCLTFYNDTHMLSGSEDRTICVWECRSWNCLKTLKGHRGHVNSVSVHPSGRLALSVAKDKTLRTWNLVNGKSAYVTNLKEAALLVKWSPGGDSYAVAIGTNVVVYKLAENILATGGEFEGIRILDIENERCLQTVKGHANRVKDLYMTEDLLHQEDKRLLLFSVSSDGDLRGWTLSPENFGLEAQLVARYEVPGRPMCLTVVGRKMVRSSLSVNTEATVQQTDKDVKGKPKKTKQEKKETTSGSGPEKKKYKKKKKNQAKKKNISKLELQGHEEAQARDEGVASTEDQSASMEGSGSDNESEDEEMTDKL